MLAAAPARVASLNLCTDSLLLELVDDQRISSITALSRDPNLSVHHARARTLPVNHGAVEEILSTRPDLVLIGSNTTAFAEHLLARIGLEVMSFATANTLDEYQANLRRLARRLPPVPRRGIAETIRSPTGPTRTRR